MAAQLSERDCWLIKTWRKAGVLQDVENHRLDQRKGVILVTCADGDRFADIFQYHVRMQIGCRSDPRIHTLSWHGGALACAPHSPVNKTKRAHTVFLNQISDAQQLKDIDVVVLEAHGPCLAAGLCGIRLEETVALHIRAKLRVKTLNQGVKVACFFHVDYENGRKRTYFLSRPDWDAWTEHNSIEVAS